MADLKFGFDQLRKETPQFIKNLRKASNFFAGGVVAFLPFLAKAFHSDTDTLANIMGMFILGVNSLAAMCGLPADNNEKTGE